MPTTTRPSRKRTSPAARTALLIALLALTFGSAGCSLLSGGRPAKVTVDAAASDPALVGKRVQVDGVVVPSSWNGHTSPMKFVLVGTEAKGLGVPDLTVLYSATTPTSAPPADFGGGTEVVVVGTIQKGGTLRAESVVDKFKPTYTSPPMSVAYLNVRSQQISGGPAELAGFVVPGSIETSANGVGRFVLEDSPDSGYTLPVKFDLQDPAVSKTLHSGREIRVSGAAGQDGSFWATRILPAK